MDEAEIRQALQQKQQNPQLQRIPLNLGNKFIKLNNTTGESEVELKSPLTNFPVLLLFFGSEWCNITKPFAKLLQKHYEEINLEKQNIQIIYVSLDKTKKDFDAFTNWMPWLGISFEDPRVKDLREFYSIKTIPTLLLLDDQGQMISSDCRQDIYALKQDEAFEKWKKIKELALAEQKQEQA